nr:MAG TPA: Immun Lantibiotic streptin immunity protein [Bacteriophage sp.]
MKSSDSPKLKLQKLNLQKLNLQERVLYRILNS